MFLFNTYFLNSRSHKDLKFFKSYQSALQQAWETKKFSHGGEDGFWFWPANCSMFLSQMYRLHLQNQPASLG